MENKSDSKLFYVKDKNSGRILACLAYRYVGENEIEYGFSILNPADFNTDKPIKRVAKNIAVGRLSKRPKSLEVKQEMNKKEKFSYLLFEFTSNRGRLLSALFDQGYVYSHKNNQSFLVKSLRTSQARCAERARNKE